MRSMRNVCAALAAAVVVAVSAPAVSRADQYFTIPTWAGSANSTSQEWDGFTSVNGPNAPNFGTTFNPNGTANAYDATYATDGAFMAGTHMYSFAGVINALITVPNYGLGSAYNTQVVLQAEVLGNPLDATAFSLTPAGGSSVAPASVSVVDEGSSGSGFGGRDFVYTVVWNVAGNASGYSVGFTPNATSSSQIAYRVDTLAALAPVPEPSSLITICVGAFSAAGLRLTRNLGRGGRSARPRAGSAV